MIIFWHVESILTEEGKVRMQCSLFDVLRVKEDSTGPLTALRADTSTGEDAQERSGFMRVWYKVD